MNTPLPLTDTAPISVPAARVAIAAAWAVLLLLACLHVLSPEFDPSWPVVSEYANGRYGWVLSLMFVSWALSSWALAVTLWSQLNGIRGKIALGFLIAAGIGEAMASVFDINHPLHNLAGMIGVLSLPIAAMLISVGLSPTPPWSAAKKSLLWMANLTWISLALMIVSLIALAVTSARDSWSSSCRWKRTAAWNSIAAGSNRAGWLCEQAFSSSLLRVGDGRGVAGDPVATATVAVAFT